jgi:hypothetical protein
MTCALRAAVDHKHTRDQEHSMVRQTVGPQYPTGSLTAIAADRAYAVSPLHATSFSGLCLAAGRARKALGAPHLEQ